MTCETGKIPYASARDAWRTASHVRLRSRAATKSRIGRNATAYRCEFCGHWHLTSTPWRAP
jgi:hypothetical protein